MKSHFTYVYLLKSKNGGTCLIDGGTKDSAPLIYDKLKDFNAWPVDRIIITHSHWDHTQGVGFLREKAAETGHSIEIMASEKALRITSSTPIRVRGFTFRPSPCTRMGFSPRANFIVRLAPFIFMSSGL